ncbi:MAG: DNA (cytosine-5-)-methyltransferase [Leptolyngbya foveolarum]|uniref:Cytosine-specific methyltransferase n=1 Tax=Leptolyngbya foveolarum TaxID=47253 RepID=A0A2W4TPH6_9CYAN|nr:MAG: DNA (cytosine-5-)-methyltransferase [Leptolyngbya foveolarum]
MTRPIVVSLFAGAGGLDLGFEQAGCDIPVAIESDRIHAITHKRNFPMWVTLNQPVEAATAANINCHLHEHPVDILIGGPPCQAFSIGGERSHTDPRSSLLSEFVRLTAALQPKFFVLENVKGLTQTHCRPVLEQAIAQFKALGYHLPDWRVLNAKNYGVPQHRERLFLLGSRADMPALRYPKPTHPDELGRFVTAADALNDIPDAEDWMAQRSIKNGELWSAAGDQALLSEYAKTMRYQTAQEMQRCYGREHQAWLFTDSHTTDHSPEVRARFAVTAPGDREPVSRFHRLKADAVAPTLRAGTDRQRGAHTAPRPIHYRYDRCLTVREMARLSGFPDWFKFDERKWHGARQIGNAVPPPLARAIACEVLKSIRKDSGRS